MKSAIRLGDYKDAKLSELARDVRDTFAQVPEAVIMRFTREYAEPMTIAFDHEPAVVRLGRVQHDASPEDAIYAAALVSFTYARGGIQVPVLEGLTLGTRYRFTFEVVG